MYFCHLIMEIYLNIGHFDFLANVRMLKFGSELRYGIRSPNVRTPVDIPNYFSSYETGQLVGGAKTGEPQEKSPGTPASRTWLVSHVARAGLEPTPDTAVR